MTKREFLRNLQDALQALPYEERNEALDYYENYFEEAGLENEQSIINELGDIKDLAQKILNNEPLLPQAVKKVQKEEGLLEKDDKEKKENFFSNNKWLIIILLVVTSPIWFSAALSVLGTVLGFVFGIISLALGLVVGSMGMAIASLVVFVGGFFFISVLPGGYLIPLGVTLLLVGFAILFGLLGIAMFTKFFPWCWKGLVSVWNKLFGTKKIKKDEQ